MKITIEELQKLTYSGHDRSREPLNDLSRVLGLELQMENEVRYLQLCHVAAQVLLKR